MAGEVGDLILALDPGWHTGWSLWRSPDLIAQGTTLDGCEGFLEWWPSPPSETVVVMEDYISDGSTAGRVWSSEVIGAVKALHRGPIVMQKRTDKANLFNQRSKGDRGQTERFDWLRSRGFGGTTHELDSITHALVYLKNRRDQGVIDRYWFSRQRRA